MTLTNLPAAEIYATKGEANAMTTATKTAPAANLRYAAEWLAQHAPDVQAQISSQSFEPKHDGPRVNFYAMSGVDTLRKLFAGQKATCRRDGSSLYYTILVDGIQFTANEYEPRDPDRSEWEVTL
jgi:hypothetical protein